MKRVLVAVSCALVLGASTASMAQGMGHNHGATPQAAPAGGGSGQAAVHSATGVVKSVDVAAGKVMLQHDPIPALNWPAMTMPFALADKAALGRLKAGQKVTFEFVQSGGSPVIKAIR